MNLIKTDKQLKVFVIGPRGFPGVQGGIEKFSEGLYPLLADKGYQITVFALKRFISHREWNGVNFILLNSPSQKALEKPIYNFLAACHCIVKRPDIIHIHSIASGMFIFLLKIFGLKVVARYNSRDYLHNKWNFFGKLILKLSERQFFLVNYIITNNKSFLEYFRSKGRIDRIQYVPNGIYRQDKKNYENSRDENLHKEIQKNNFVLFVGRVTQEKNIETLIKAFLLIDQKTLKLVIAGDTAHNDNYFRTLKNKYSDPGIIFTGKLERESINWLYANCSLFVIPSFSEGTPNAILEAMSFNCKIIASRIPAHLEFSFSEQEYFDPHDLSELKEKMNRKILSSEIEDYHSKLESHRWPSVVEAIHEIHMKLLSGI